MCASHNGEPVHLGAVRALLERAELGPQSLRTPPRYPLDPDEMARAQHRHPLYSDCSGKHAGMLLACVRAGWTRRTYPRRSHPLQRRVLRASSERPALTSARGSGSTDAASRCRACRLRAIATLYAQARRARPPRRAWRPLPGGPSTPCSPSRTSSEAGTAFDSDLMQAVPGVIAKEGAEALLCVSVPEMGIGVALKVADGRLARAGPAMIETLTQLGALDAASAARPRAAGASGGPRRRRTWSARSSRRRSRSARSLTDASFAGS